MFLRKLLRFMPRSALGRALGASNRGDFAAAAALLDELLATSPAPSADVVLYATEAHLECASAREAAGDWAGALQSLERAATLRPQWADVHQRLGRVCEHLDQPQRARDAYERALAVNPRYFAARLSLARLLMQLEDRAGALRQLQEAAQSGPAYAAPELQELVRELPEQTTSTGRRRLERRLAALMAGPPSPAAAGLEVARAALRNGDDALAIRTLKGLLQQHPDFPDLHNLLGVAYENEEMTDDAVEEFEIALRLNPDFLDAELNLGLALHERGRDAEAERHLRAVAERGGGNELAASVLAQIAARSGSR